MTYSVGIFLESARAIRANTLMVPRSDNDKEYFPQDWFIDRLKSLGLPFEQLGRNSYPDFWVGDPKEGYEVKSLAFNGRRAARTSYDANSSIPSGRKENRDVFLAFFLYTGSAGHKRPVHTLSIAHADLINCDHSVAQAHENVAIREFGSFGDGFIRDRKMYVFPHPISIDSSGLSRARLIVPTSWKVANPALKKVGKLSRKIIPQAVSSYTIHLHQAADLTVNKVPYPNAGAVLEFDVFEEAGF